MLSINKKLSGLPPFSQLPDMGDTRTAKILNSPCSGATVPPTLIEPVDPVSSAASVSIALGQFGRMTTCTNPLGSPKHSLLSTTHGNNLIEIPVTSQVKEWHKSLTQDNRINHVHEL